MRYSTVRPFEAHFKPVNLSTLSHLKKKQQLPPVIDGKNGRTDGQREQPANAEKTAAGPRAVHHHPDQKSGKASTQQGKRSPTAPQPAHHCATGPPHAAYQKQMPTQSASLAQKK